MAPFFSLGRCTVMYQSYRVLYRVIPPPRLRPLLLQLLHLRTGFFVPVRRCVQVCPACTVLSLSLPLGAKCVVNGTRQETWGAVLPRIVGKSRPGNPTW